MLSILSTHQIARALDLHTEDSSTELRCQGLPKPHSHFMLVQCQVSFAKTERHIQNLQGYTAQPMPAH